jgi:hypothetical protein
MNNRPARWALRNSRRLPGHELRGKSTTLAFFAEPFELPARIAGKMLLDNARQIGPNLPAAPARGGITLK